MLNYDFPLYRPPSEGQNLIIQATIGCSFNRCTFCSMYHEKQFRERPLEDVFRDIDVAAQHAPQTRRVFLADGDALVLPTERLLRILHHLTQAFPKLTRISSYALPANLLTKTEEELTTLRQAGLTLLYYGIESGNADLLKKISKGASPAAMIKGLNRAHHAGMKISATVILGLGGKQHSTAHINDTAALISQCPVTYLSTLQLGLDPAIADRFYQRFDAPFEWLDDDEMLVEQLALIEQIEPLSPIIFRSNHASNALPLKGVLPKDKAALLHAISAARQQPSTLIPHWMRGY